VAQTKPITPGIQWCSHISQQRGVTTRCPFATVETCPRYYGSRDVLRQLGKLDATTELKAEDDTRLRAKWKQHPAGAKLSEDPPNASEGYYASFCPEVLLDLEGLSATILASFVDEIDRDSRHRILDATKTDKMDWQWKWADLRPLHYSDCALYAILLRNPDPARESA
jgi:hypothetical protein